MKDDDKIFESLIRSIENDVEPSKGFKEQLLADIMYQSKIDYEPSSFLEKVFFVSPWKFTVPVSLVISFFISISMGSSFNKMVSMIFGLGGF